MHALVAGIQQVLIMARPETKLPALFTSVVPEAARRSMILLAIVCDLEMDSDSAKVAKHTTNLNCPAAQPPCDKTDAETEAAILNK